jgi:molybdenum cofactor cytidylyltransferase
VQSIHNLPSKVRERRMNGGLVLAAGRGSRFGAPKQLAEFDGRPLIEHAISAIYGASGIDRVVVVLGAQAELIRDRADLGRAEVVVAPDWSEGIAASLRAGVAALATAQAIVVTLADQPFITSSAIAAVLARIDSPAPAARATFGGRCGHPVLLKRALFAEVAQLRGDVGARDLLQRADVELVACDDLASDVDIDTPTELAAARSAWRARS